MSIKKIQNNKPKRRLTKEETQARREKHTAEMVELGKSWGVYRVEKNKYSK